MPLRAHADKSLGRFVVPRSRRGRITRLLDGKTPAVQRLAQLPQQASARRDDRGIHNRSNPAAFSASVGDMKTNQCQGSAQVGSLKWERCASHPCCSNSGNVDIKFHCQADGFHFGTSEASPPITPFRCRFGGAKSGRQKFV